MIFCSSTQEAKKKVPSKVSLLGALLTRLLDTKKRYILVKRMTGPCQRCSCSTRSEATLAELEL